LIVQVTRRLFHGLTNQTSYTFSKALGEDSSDTASNFRDVNNRQGEKTLLSFNRVHSFRSSGTFELPFGPNRQFLPSSSGLVARLIERWQFGGIANWTSGAPLSLGSSIATFNSSATSTATANTPNIIGLFPTGKVVPATDIAGARYFDGLVQTTDPGCGNLTASETLNTLCTNKGIQDSKGNFLLVNPNPGQLGNLGKGTIIGPSSFQFDVDLIKRVKISERKEFEIRLDAINILNHSIWANPTLDINSANFGRISNKTGNRTFTINTRINF
jgi:hypothetical protein